MDPLEPVRWLHHGSICLEANDIVIYIDPYEVKGAPHDADLVIITHAHSDHFSPEDIEKVRQSDTCFVSTKKIVQRLERDFNIDDCYLTALSFASPPAYFECGATVAPIVAENSHHPIDAGFGCVLEFAGFKYYFSGDTDILATDVRCDALFVACDGIYNMPNYETLIPQQIKEMDVLPLLVVPYHYSYEATQSNGDILCAALLAQGINAQTWTPNW